ncbi:hypothetical protein F5B20DRAFT_531244 [Whalleya microplaca]|nr:hypothetical protein F5B20DRAFT_531244 [Whalleya microplaca]
MAELLGTIVAVAQAADYCLLICAFFRTVIGATATLRRYLDDIQESQCVLREVATNPSLQTTEIKRYTTELIGTIEAIQVPRDYQNRNRFLASITFAVKQKHYGEIFSLLEKKKITLLLYIANSNSTVLGDIRVQVERLRIQSAHHLTENSNNYNMDMTKNSKQELPECLRTGFESSDSGYTSAMSSTPPASAEFHSSPFPRVEDEEAEYGCQFDSNSTKPDTDAPSVELQNNHHTGAGMQILGTMIESKENRVTSKQLLKITSKFNVMNNKMSGVGDQVVGQYIKKGCLPMPFAGNYKGNIKTNKGDQVIGLRL